MAYEGTEVPVSRSQEQIRKILIEEQDHLTALATALGIDAPDPSK